MLKQNARVMPKYFQGGAALLVFLTIVLLGGAYLLVSALKTSTQQVRKDQQTARALAQAKEGLLAFATLYPEQHNDMPVGFLPCPDADGDGSAELVCGLKGQSVIGRLPWRTLKLPPLRDGAGECLWYAVSGTYKYNPQWELNSDTDGLFLVKSRDVSIEIGADTASRAIAIIFAPGQTINNQNRSATEAQRTECGSTVGGDGVNQAGNYLDSLAGIDNAQGTDSGAAAGEPGSVPISAIPAMLASVFVHAPSVVANAKVVFNDALVAITPDDYRKVFARMDHWVAQRVAGCLEKYGDFNDGLFPWQSSMSATPDYFDDEDTCYGRIANAIGSGGVNNLQGLANTQDSNSDMAQRWEDYPGAGRCFYEAGVNADDWWWWAGWKDKVFVAVDPNFAPAGSGDDNDLISQLELDGTPQEGVVMVAGRRLPGQNRAAGTAAIADYLEGDNATWSDYRFSTSPAGGGPFNDVVLGFNSAAGGMAGGMMGGASCTGCTCGMCNCGGGMGGMDD